MFMLPRNPFDEWPKWWTMTDQALGRTRGAGVMEPLYWSPMSPVFYMSAHEAAKLPQRVVWFGTTQNIPNEGVRFVAPECRNLPFLVQSNFEVPDSLKAILAEVCAAARDGCPADAWDAAKVRRLLELQQQALQAFDACAAASRSSMKLKCK